MLNIKENYIQVSDLPTQQALKNINENLHKIGNQLKGINEKLNVIEFEQQTQNQKINELENEEPLSWGGCKVTLSSNQSISTSGAHKILWDTEVFDTLGEFASNKYTATYAGIYLITATLDYVDMGDQKDMLALIYVNNSPIAQFDHKSSSANYESTSCTVIQSLSASDYVEVFTDHAHGSNRDVLAGERYSWLCVQRIT